MKDKIRKLFCEAPALDNIHLSFSDKKGKVHGGNREEQTQQRYEACQASWNHVKDQELPDGSRIEWFKEPNHGNVRGFVITEREEIAGFIGGSTNYYPDFKNFMKVHVVYVYDEYQGKGYGLALYEGAIDLLGGIYSDYTLTTSSLGVWKKLAKKYPVYKEIMNNGKKTFKPIKNLDAEMGSTSEPFIATKKPIKI